MPRTGLPALVLAILAAVFFGGCAQEPKKTNPVPDVPVPVWYEGTVGQYASVDRTWDISVGGYGIVIGLGTNGSGEVDPSIEQYLTTMLKKYKLGSPTANTEDITPGRILRDKDTAVVLAGGSIPLGAPEGTRFDVTVSALPRSQTSSLVGGYLMPADMMIAPAGIMPRLERSVHTFGEVGGSLFINPFIDPTKTADMVKLREGRIIGGGVVTRAVPIRLVLREGDFARVQRIQQRINERFKLRPHTLNSIPSERVASATSINTVELQVPEEYHDDFVRFVRLVLHLPLATEGGAVEATGRRIARLMEEPGANCAELAMVWEAMGKGALPVVRTTYSSHNPEAAFWAAYTGMRLGDDSGAELLARAAENPDSRERLAAIEGLGYEKTRTGTDTLVKLLDDDNLTVRLMAYEALSKRPDHSDAITRYRLDDNFTLDVVRCKDPDRCVVYATQTKEQKIVLFGDMPVQTPVFMDMPDHSLTVDCPAGQDKLAVSRLIPRTQRPSDRLKVAPRAAMLIKALGSRPRNVDTVSLPNFGRPDERHANVVGLGASYGQVVALLSRMCERGDIRAKFVLQPITDAGRIYRGTEGSGGRPDAPVATTQP